MIEDSTTGGVMRYLITLQTSRIGAASQQCDKFATVLYISNSDNAATVWDLCNSVAMLYQCCWNVRIICNVCESVRVEHMLALILLESYL